VGFPPGPPAYQTPRGYSAGYGEWVPSQRSSGSVYGGAQAPAAPHYEPLENTDSLTGHILAQGRPDIDGSGNTVRVVAILLIMLAAVVVVTVIAIS
jgi:hypothetical protein